MNERTMQLRLGITVLASIVIIVILLTFLSSQSRFSNAGYQVFIQLADAPGVMENTPIYQSGILIGRVSKVELVHDEGVLVTARIFRGYTLYRDQQCHLTTTFLGDASLRMVKMPPVEGAAPPDTSEVEPGDTILGRVAFDPVAIVGKMQERLSVAIDDVSAAAIQLNQVAESTDAMIEENRTNIQGIVENARSITNDSRDIVHQFSQIVDDDFRENLTESVAALPGTLREVEATFQTMKTSVETASGNVNEAMLHIRTRMDHSLDLVDHSLENFQKISEPLVAKSGAWAETLDSILMNVDAMMENANNPDTTLGLIMRDRRLYDQLLLTTERVADIPRRLDPILFNAQVFSEKIAQHPELLGVRGALRPDSGTSRKIPWPKGMTLGSERSRCGDYGDWSSAPMSYPGYESAPRQVAPVRPNPEPLPPSVLEPEPVARLHAPAREPAPRWKAPDPAVGTHVHPAPGVAREVTPEMLGMTPEEFALADIDALSERVFTAPATTPGDATLALPPTE